MPPRKDGVNLNELQANILVYVQKLRSENTMFQRLMYKNKNQHRTTLYYRSLSKVRRDLNLLERFDLKMLLNKHFQVIRVDKPTQKISLLESLKKGKSAKRGADFQKQLLGVARLLAQMTEAIIDAGLKISTLLGQTFFMAFSLTMLAFLARIRVLVQQILIDVVYVFNMSASVSQDKQSSRITKDGHPVFRDYYPPHKPVLILECHWDGVKYFLLEKFDESKRNIEDGEILPVHEHEHGDVQGIPKVSAIKYNIIEGLEEATGAAELNQDGYLHGNQREELSIDVAKEDKRTADENLAFQECSDVGLVRNNCSLGSEASSSYSLKECEPAKVISGTKRKVAFLAVNLPPMTKSNAERPGKKLKASSDSDLSEKSPTKSTKSLDPFFSLLFDGNKPDSLF